MKKIDSKEMFESNMKDLFEPPEEEITISATTILPPGSTSADLQSAINSATSGDVIEISSNMIFLATTVTIPVGKTITIQSTEGNNWILSQSNDSIRHFTVDGGPLILQNITLNGNNVGGGISVTSNGALTTNSNTIIQYCYNTNGGAVIVHGRFIMNKGTLTNNRADIGGAVFAEGVFSMFDGDIINNTANSSSGGIVVRGQTFTMSGGNISNNISIGSGGGVSLIATATPPIFNMSGGKITNNKTGNGGGGVYMLHGTFNMSGGTISENEARVGGGIFTSLRRIVNITGEAYITDNTASENGGGIYVERTGSLNVTGTSYITGNIAGGVGGGIYTDDTAYASINTNSNTRFTSNIASLAYIPPANASTLYPKIGFLSTSITNHPLNGYDIIYTGTRLVFNVTYNANGGTGSHIGPNVNPLKEDIILSLEDTEISRIAYTFTRWNTESDDSGTSYMANDSIILSDNVILYAQWKINEYTVRFESNGGTPVTSQTVTYGERAIEPTNPTRQGYTFEGWYSDDETFVNKWDFATLITEDMTLYAKWSLNQYTVYFESNGGTPVTSQTVNHGQPATRPLDPTREGYSFDGWYSDNVTFLNKLDFVTSVTDVTFLDEWDFSTPITEDMTLYAKWSLNQHTVYFESNKGTPIASQTVNYGQPATKPPDPTRENYTFDGWYSDDKTFENKWDFATMITADIILYAKWTEYNRCRCVLLIILILTLIYYMQCYDCRCRYRCSNYYNYILIIDRILPLI